MAFLMEKIESTK